MLKKYALLRVVQALLARERYFSLRELARAAGVGVDSAKRSVDYLSREGVMIVQTRPRSYAWGTDVLAKHVRILNTLALIKQSHLVEQVVEACEPLAVILYGSAARGDNTPGSDLDILIIMRKPCAWKPLPAERALDREVAVLKYTMSEWRTKAREDKAFYDRVLLDGIALYGEKPVVA